MATQTTIDLGAGKLRDTDYPIEASIQLASRTIVGFSRWIPRFGKIEPIPGEWNVQKPGWMVLEGDQPVLCNTGRDTSAWKGTWIVGRECTYKCDSIIVTNARTGDPMFALTGLKMDAPANMDGSWTFPDNADIHIVINNVPG